MTSPNMHIPTYFELRDERNDAMGLHELQFWKTKAEFFQGQLEKIFDGAKEHGVVTLQRVNEKIVLRKDPP